MRKGFIGILGIITCIAMGCDRPEPDTGEPGDMSIVTDLTAALEAGYEVTSAVVTLLHLETDTTVTVALDIDGASATGSATLRPGQWQVTVELFEETELLGQGVETVTVLSGNVTQVKMRIVLVSGGMEIIVDWGESSTLIGDVGHLPVEIQIQAVDGTLQIEGLSKIGWEIEVLEIPGEGGQIEKAPGVITTPNVSMLNLTGTDRAITQLTSWIGGGSPLERRPWTPKRSRWNAG